MAKPGVAKGNDPAGTKRPALLPDDCEIGFELYGEDDGAEVFRSAPACMKREGDAVSLPTVLDLYYGEHLYYPFDRGMCGNEGQLADANKSIYRCQWNGVFRDRFPITFRIFATEGSPTTVDEAIQLIHVFRNGKLAFKWTAPAQTVTEVLIPGEQLESDGVPHLAPIDLRVYPTGTADETLLELDVAKPENELRRRLELMATTALSESFTESSDAVKCLLSQVDELRNVMAKEVGASAPAPLAKGATTCPTEKGQLVALYEEAKAHAAKEATATGERLLTEVEKRLSLDIETLLSQLRTKKAELEAKLAASPAAADVIAEIEKIAGIIAALDRVATKMLEILDAGNDVVVAVKTDVKKLTSDPAEAARLHGKVAEALAEEGDFFEPYGKNPAPVADERILDMEYSDGLQGFAFAPWLGIPFRTNAKSQPSPTYGLPIIDVVGFRYQWAASRFADIRFVPLGSMVFEDLRRPDDPATGSEDEGEGVIRWALVPSISVANFKFGVAILPYASPQPGAARYIRFVAGADLFKLISGRDLEGF